MRNAAFKKIFYEAKKNKKIIFIGSDLGYGVMEEMKKTLPQQFFMEGVCEQNIVGLSEIKINKFGLISYHKDYWDSFNEFYIKLPIFGFIFKIFYKLIKLKL